jgi:hypothetical protein
VDITLDVVKSEGRMYGFESNHHLLIKVEVSIFKGSKKKQIY